MDGVWEAAPETARRYVLLALRLARHDEGLVDAYFGPAAPARDAGAGAPHAPDALLREAAALADAVPDGWLGDQVAALRTAARLLTGERIPYADEVAARFGVVPSRTPEAVFDRAHAALEALLPGSGPVAARHAAWRTAARIPPERAAAVVRAAIAAAREATAELVRLPDGEGVDVEVVDDVPWMAYCEYLGGYRSRITVNASLPATAFELARLAMHETYPGHHVERAVKERDLVRGRGLIEETLVLAPSPQSVVSEGIAESAPLALLEGPAGPRVGAALEAAGAGTDLGHAVAVERAMAPLRWAEVNAGLMLHGDGAAPDAVAAYLERWALMAPELAAHMVRFLADPASRGYEITYAAGADLCRAWLAGAPRRLAALLGAPLRVRDLAVPAPA